MPYISQNTILEVKRACDIFEVVSHYLPLKRAGAGYKALCPFHEEKTPSFNVNPARQIFKCFGCGEGGGVIDFVLKHEKVEFHEAVKILAERAGIRLEYEGGGKQERGRDFARDVLRWAAQGYHEFLMKADRSHPGWKFLQGKHISEDTVREFQLGLSPDEWDGLIRKSRAKGIPPAALEQAGLVVKTEEGRVYDRFRNRLMIPVLDQAGRIVTFGGRALSDRERAKYMNGPETRVFQKSRTLYGLHLLKGRAASDPITVVEGYFDVIGPWQNGVRGLVATLGTSLTRDHLGVLRRHTTDVGVLFDSDEAGRRATDRAWSMFFGYVMDAVVDLRICTLPPGRDPDEIDGDLLRKILSERREVVDVAIDALSREHDPESSAGRVAIIDALIGLLGGAERTTDDATFRRDQILARIADRFRTDLRDLKRRVATVRGAAPIRPVQTAPRRTPEERLVKELLAAALDAPGRVLEVCRELEIEALPLEAAQPLFKKIFEMVDQEEPFETSDLLALFTDRAEVRQLLLEMEDRVVHEEEDAGARLEQCMKAYSSWRERTRRKRLREQLRASGDPNVARAIQDSLSSKKSLNREDR